MDNHFFLSLALISYSDMKVPSLVTCNADKWELLIYQVLGRICRNYFLVPCSHQDNFMVVVTSLDYRSFIFQIPGLDIDMSNDFYCSTNDMMSSIEVAIFGLCILSNGAKYLVEF